MDFMLRDEFLRIALIFQGGLIGLGLGLAWLLGIDPWARMDLSGRTWLVAAVSTLPMLAVFVLTYRAEWRPLRDIRDFLVETLGPPLSECRWYEILGVAVLAGVSEELLFRAVLQDWLSPWGTAWALIGSNVLFGAAHAVTALYAVLAAGMGLYLGGLYELAGDRNVVVPAVTHATYDWIAFLIVRGSYRSGLARPHHSAAAASTPVDATAESGRGDWQIQPPPST